MPSTRGGPRVCNVTEQRGVAVYIFTLIRSSARSNFYLRFIVQKTSRRPEPRMLSQYA